MLTKSTSILSKLTLATLLVLSMGLQSCASKLQSATSENNGPAFLLEGRLSVRQVTKPIVISNFSWARGILADGWSERLTFTDPNGTRILRVTSDNNGTVATTPRRSFRDESLQTLLKRYLGINLEPRILAGWLNNEHAGGPLPSEFELDKTQVQVIERKNDGRPQRLRILHKGTLLLIAIQRFEEG